MAIELEHKNEFINDTEKILDRLNRLLTANVLSISSIFREVHSLKGAAGFAGLVNMEHLAHTFEGFLSGIRDGNISLDKDIEKLFFHIHDFFIQDIKLWRSNSTELEIKELLKLIEDKSIVTSPLSIEMINDKPLNDSFFTSFEQTLLKEAMYRGEQFYRIICHIDREEEMKYPRLFLVINNLETISNVVKIYPPMDQLNKNQSKQITLYITTDKSKNFIYKGLSFDRIREIEFLRLEYSSYFNQQIQKSEVSGNNLYGSTIDVETSKIEEIFNYSQDLHNKLLLDNLVIPDKRPLVEELLTGMKQSLTSLTTITTNKAFSYFHNYCNKLGDELGKKVLFSIEGGEISINRQLAETLKELLIQLVKNSIDHGIESEVERVAAGKSPNGHITLKISQVKDSLAITLKDDGRGVDLTNVVQKGIDNNFIDKDEEISLLSLLSRPGFSTSKDINYYSGRGIGLDLVVNRVINKLDGKVKAENKKGQGISFHILIPPKSSVKKYTLFKYRNHSFAFSLVNVVEKLTLNQDSLILGENSTLSYKHKNVIYPIFTPWGRLSSNLPTLNEKYGFILRYLGKKAFFPVDEFVLEKEFFSSVLTFIDTETATHKKVLVNDNVEDFTFILPSIINC
ncbi:MAG: ATP-binding protein [Spirochaetaceae bacterium]